VFENETGRNHLFVDEFVIITLYTPNLTNDDVKPANKS